MIHYHEDYKIEIEPDYNAESPASWDNNDVYLIFEHREFTVKQGNFSVSNVKEYLELKQSDKVKSSEELEELNNYKDLDEYDIFPVSAYIHSGISLSLGNTYGWDNSNAGFILVNKTFENSKEIAKGLLNDWNIYVSGEVLCYIIYQKKIRYSISKENYDTLVFEDNLSMIGDYFTEGIDWEIVGSCGGYYLTEEEVLEEVWYEYK